MNFSRSRTEQTDEEAYDGRSCSKKAPFIQFRGSLIQIWGCVILLANKFERAWSSLGLTIILASLVY